ncbi:MAG: hypothetical protein V4454_10805 [Pseudomonadota bacterium]
MKRAYLFFTAVALLVGCMGQASAAARLNLSGYSDADGVITVLYHGESADPYFAMQALLLAHENGLDISVPAQKFASWLVPGQKPDGTFDRFCRTGSAPWASCKTADADDALLAIWMKLLETMPAYMNANPALTKSYAVSKNALEHLFQPSRGIYMVSPVYLHGLFMDNLEVWSLKSHLKQPGQRTEADKLASAIQKTFWEPVSKRFLVSTQLEQRSEKAAFYPDHVAQIFPLLVGFPLLHGDAASHYRKWMSQHRSDWLSQGKTDYPWGLIAVLALRQDDKVSARCWLRESQALRHSSRWAVTDEVAYQILVNERVTPASSTVVCQ